VFETEARRRFIQGQVPVNGQGKENFGDRLKRERELREVSIEELTKATDSGRLSKHSRMKIGAGCTRRLWPRVRAHDRTLSGLNEEAFLGEYDLARADHLAAAPLQTPRGKHSVSRRSGFQFWTLLLAYFGRRTCILRPLRLARDRD